MSIDKTEFFEYAKALPEDSELNRRNAISRTYYAAYHASLAIYKPSHSNNGGVHKKLIDGLINSPNTKDKQIGYILKNLKALRTTADYLLTNDLSINDKQTAIKQTERLLSILTKP